MVKVILGTAAALLALTIFLAVLGVIPGLVNLGVMPWVTHQQTMIYRNSLGSSTANIAQLRNLYTAYLGASNIAQQNAIVAQMHSVADNMNKGDLPPDIAAFLASHD